MRQKRILGIFQAPLFVQTLWENSVEQTMPSNLATSWLTLCRKAVITPSTDKIDYNDIRIGICVLDRKAWNLFKKYR